MKTVYRICGKITLLCYLILLYQTWHLCRYGGVRHHFIILLPVGAVFLISVACWIVSRKNRPVETADSAGRKAETVMRIEIIIAVAVTLFFGAGIAYSAIPYNGALSWKFDEWMRERKVTLVHNNFFEDGVEGVLADLDEKLDLPEELYIVNQYQMRFDGEGTIRSIYAFLYGRDEKGDTRTYLVDYDADKSEKMSVWVDGEANETYDERMRLDPMLRILKEAPCREQCAEWIDQRGPEIYEILYMGRRSFATSEGLVYIPGDADGDGQETNVSQIAQLIGGGEVIGYEVSLHIPAADEVIPVRYMMEPEYISAAEVSAQNEEEQEEAAKDAEGWTVDNSTGTMRYFLDDSRGWSLVVADAAAGSRFYVLEKTEDGGTAWNTVNEDPFGGEIGAAEGLEFFDESFGFAGLSGAAGSASRIYMTRDGGATFIEISLPLDTVTELPETAGEYGHVLQDYDYLEMPEKEGDTLTIRVVVDAGETDGLMFRSEDAGVTWIFDGTFTQSLP